MDEKNLPSSSDESDADFVPKEEDENSDSKSELSDYETSDGENNTSKSRKRKKKTKKGGKKLKTNNIEEEQEEDKEVAEKKQEIDVDALWADFKKDVETKKTTECSHPSTEMENESNKESKSPAQTNPAPNKLKGGFNFPNKNKVGGGLSKVLNQIGKKDKMSTLQKSQLDWNNFKKNEGIEEEIKMYNRGKDGYLEKQDFLQRTDLRQFEIEKDLRSARRKF